MMTFVDVICAHGCMAIRLMHPPPPGACADNVTAMLGVDLGSQSVVGKVNAVTDLEGKDVSARCAPAGLVFRRAFFAAYCLSQSLADAVTACVALRRSAHS